MTTLRWVPGDGGEGEEEVEALAALWPLCSNAANAAENVLICVVPLLDYKPLIGNYALGTGLGKGGVATVVAARYVHTLTLVTAYH